MEKSNDHRHHQLSVTRPLTREEARSIFLTTAPTYQGVTGLVRKSYVIAEDGNSVGGIYL